MIMTHGLNSHVPVVTKVKTVREGRLASARNATPDLVKKSGTRMPSQATYQGWTTGENSRSRRILR